MLTIALALLASRASAQAPGNAIFWGPGLWPVSAPFFVSQGTSLVILPGTTLSVTNPGFILTVAGALTLDGTKANPIVVDGGGVGMGFVEQQYGGTIAATFSTFRNFRRDVITLELCGSGSLTVADSTFASNAGAVKSTRCSISFNRTTFSHHTGVAAVFVDSWYGGVFHRFYDCTFSDQYAAIYGGAGYVQISNSTFSGHSGQAISHALSVYIIASVFSNNNVALASGGYVFDSIFLNNAVAIEFGNLMIYSSLFVSNPVTIGSSESYLTDVVILNTNQGVKNPLQITRGWICGLQGLNPSLITVTDSPFGVRDDVAVSSVWFGTSGTTPAGLALIRGSVIDAYWKLSLGMIMLTDPAPNISSVPWPATLQPYFAKYSPLCTPPPDAGFSISQPPSGGMFTDTQWGPGDIIVSAPVFIVGGATLLVLPGTRLLVTSPDFLITVRRGALILNGSAAAPIVVDGGGVGLHWAHTSTFEAFIFVSFSTFRRFSGAVFWSMKCRGALTVTDSVFSDNDVAIDLNRCSAANVVRTVFLRHSGRAAILSTDFSNQVYDNCTFSDQSSAIIVEESGSIVISASVFSAHTRVALSATVLGSFDISTSSFVNNQAAVSSHYVSINSSFFANNSVAVTALSIFPPRFIYETNSYAETELNSISDSFFCNNSVALTGTALHISSSLFASNPVTIASTNSYLTEVVILDTNQAVINPQSITGGWICGLHSPSAFLISLSFPLNVIVSGVWFGTPTTTSMGLALVRGNVHDGYWTLHAGVVVLSNRTANASAWPTTLQPYFSVYAPLCTPPPDVGFDPANPPSGGIYADEQWGPGEVTVSAPVFIVAGATLYIVPGTRLHVTSPDFLITVAGALRLDGTLLSPVIIDGGSFGVGFAATATIAGKISVTFSTFRNFVGAVFSSTSTSDQCPADSGLAVADSVFEFNRAAIEFSFCTTFVTRTLFSYHTGSSAVTFVDGHAHHFDSCTFSDQASAIFGDGSYSVYASVFSRHSNAALVGFGNSFCGIIQSTFTENVYCTSGEMGFNIVDSAFVNNDNGVFGGGGSIRDSTFANNTIAVFFKYVASISTTLFVNNSVAASLNGRDSVVSSSLFISNPVAVSSNGAYLRDVFILDTNLGVSNPFSITGGWICGLKGPDASLATLSASYNVRVDGVWFGVPTSTQSGLSLVRGCLRDGYWVANTGVFSLLAPVASAAMPWPDKFQSYFSTHAASCTPPPDVGFNLSAPPTGLCTSCAQGSYSNVCAGLCVPCPSGFTSLGFNAPCRPCDPGFFSRPGAALCSPCPLGSFSNQSGSGSCALCPAGSFSAAPSSLACGLCDPGFFSQPGAALCSPCPAGSFSNRSGLGSCALCPAGTFSASPASLSCGGACNASSAAPGTSCNAGATSALPSACSRGFYCPGNSLPIPCSPLGACQWEGLHAQPHNSTAIFSAPGYIVSSIFAQSLTCQGPIAGRFVSHAGNGACESAPAPSLSLSGFSYKSFSNVSCTSSSAFGATATFYQSEGCSPGDVQVVDDFAVSPLVSRCTSGALTAQGISTWGDRIFYNAPGEWSESITEGLNWALFPALRTKLLPGASYSTTCVIGAYSPSLTQWSTYDPSNSSSPSSLEASFYFRGAVQAPSYTFTPGVCMAYNGLYAMASCYDYARADFNVYVDSSCTSRAPLPSFNLFGSFKGGYYDSFYFQASCLQPFPSGYMTAPIPLYASVAPLRCYVSANATSPSTMLQLSPPKTSLSSILSDYSPPNFTLCAAFTYNCAGGAAAMLPYWAPCVHSESVRVYDGVGVPSLMVLDYYLLGYSYSSATGGNSPIVDGATNLLGVLFPHRSFATISNLVLCNSDGCNSPLTDTLPDASPSRSPSRTPALTRPPTRPPTGSPTASPSPPTSLSPTPSPPRTPTGTPTATLSTGASPSVTASISKSPSFSSSNRASPTRSPTPSLPPLPSGNTLSGSPSLSSTPTAPTAPIVVARVVLTLPRAVGNSILQSVLALLLAWLSLQPDTPAAITGAPGAGGAVAYTFALRISLTGRLLQGGVGSIDALLTSKLGDGSLVAIIAESGLAPSLGYDSADSLMGAVSAPPAELLLPSATPSAAPPAGGGKAAAALSTGAIAGVVVGLTVGVALMCAAARAWKTSSKVVPGTQAAAGPAEQLHLRAERAHDKMAWDRHVSYF